MKKSIFKVFALLMIFAMVVVPASAQPAAKGSGPDEISPVDLSEVTVRHLTPNGVEQAIRGVEGTARFIIELEDQPLATYAGGVSGLRATTPSVTGSVKLDAKSIESKAYLAYLQTQQTDTLKSIESVLGRTVKPAFQYMVGLNGFAVDMTADELSKVTQEVGGIVRVEREQMYHLNTDVGPEFIGATSLWEDPEEGNKGEGIVVGIIDSGINFDHPSFAEVGPVDGYVHENPLGDGVFLGVCDSTNAAQFDDSYDCNNKLIGAYSFVDTDEYELYSPEDAGGHGSHTASTVAGNKVVASIVTDTLTETQTISGVAPHANIIAYDACVEDATDGGCPTTALIAAINQAIIDGVDVINYSISGGSDPYNNLTEQLFLSATTAGVFVSASAGNDGPAPETTDHRSPWLITVAASTHNRTYINALTGMTGGDTTPPVDLIGKGFTSGTGSLPIVYAGDFGNAMCLKASDGGVFNPGTDFTGQIVVCDRGISARVEKAEIVAALGAEGYVLANSADEGNSLVGDAYVIPGVHIGYDDGVLLKTWLASGTGHTATIQGATRDLSASNANVMADFSSRGPNVALDILKPDVSAPGVDIWAALNSPTPGSGDPEYGFMSGTSMASPHTAGAGALLVAAHPDWTPMEIKSALMLTAVNTGIKKEDGVTDGDKFDFGAGVIQVDLAAQAGLIMNETEANFTAANPEEGGNPQDLNMASVYNSMCLSECSWTRTVKNALDVTASWTVTTAADTGVVITVSPSTFTLDSGATQVLTITANVDAAEMGEWAFGDIQLVEDSELAPASHMPLAVIPTAGVMPELVTVNARRNAGSQLVEGLQAVEITELTTESFGLVEADMEEFTLLEDPTYGDPIDDLDQVYVAEVVLPAGTLRFTSEIAATTSSDLDMFLYFGAVAEDNLIDDSATETAYEQITVMNPPAGTYYLVVQNWEASGAGVADDITLATALVNETDAGNMTVTGPAAVAQGEPFDVRLSWDIPEMEAGDLWYGALSLGSSSSTPGDIGVIPVDIVRYADDVTKTTDVQRAFMDDIVTYTITVQPNISGKDLLYSIEDTIPAGMELVPGSITGGAALTDGKITWSGVMPGGRYYDITTNATDPMCNTGLGTGAYVDLEDYAYPVIPGFVGDGTELTISGSVTDPFMFYGNPYTSFSILDDGFIVFDLDNNYGGKPWIAQSVPDVALPNNVAAVLWQDMVVNYDVATNQGATVANLTTNGVPSGKLVEIDDIESYENPGETYDIEAIVRYGINDTPGRYEIVYAYDNISAISGNVTVGTENVLGTRASALVNAGDASSVITNGTIVCLDWVEPTEPHVITYQLKVVTEDTMDATSTLTHSVDQEGSEDVYVEITVRLNEDYLLYLPLITK